MKYLLTLFFATALLASTSTHSKKVTASDAVAYDYFGSSVAISGTVVAVGAKQGSNDTGAVYMYEYNTTSQHYNQIAKLTAPTLTNDNFVQSVAISGDVVVAGADGNGGAVYLYEKPASGWADMMPSATLTASDGIQDDHFGYSVAIDGDVIVVGAYGDDNVANNSGSLYIFEKPALGWSSMTQSAKLTASDAAANDLLGISVAINGNVVVAGAYTDYDGYADSGSIYLFEKNTTRWSDMNHSAKLTASDTLGAENIWLGCSVAIEGDVVAAGAFGDDVNGSDTGSVYLFEKSGLLWSDMNHSAKLIPFDAESYDEFGRGGVAISGDTIIASTYYKNNSGSAYLFKKTALYWSDMNQSTKLTAFDEDLYDRFGWGVAIDGDTVVVGAPYNGDDGFASGSAYIFNRNTPQFSATPLLMYLLN